MSHDTWIHRLARLCIQPLIDSSVTPNHLTIARGVSGVIASVLLAIATPLTIAWGSVLFAFSMLLDRADGELARATRTTSAEGHFLDLYVDALCDVSVLVALGIALRAGELGLWAPIMGLVAGLSAGAIFRLVIRVDRACGAGSVMFPSIAGVDPDDLIIIVPVALLLGVGDWVLIAATVSTPLALWLAGRHLRAMLHAARR